MGAKLFERTPDGWRVTPAGRELVARAERMEEEALAVERSLVGADERLSGVVRVTATEMLATRFIAPHLWRFRREHPELTLDLVCTNVPLDLSRREVDVALRLARPREQSVVAKRLARIELALYASPRYLEVRGVPEDPERDLAGHDVLLFADSRTFARENRWLEGRLGAGRVALRSDSVSSLYSAAVGGLGIALLPRAVADADPSLQLIETESAPEPRDVWQMVHRDVKTNARIRAVTTFLAKLIR